MPLNINATTTYSTFRSINLSGFGVSMVEPRYHSAVRCACEVYFIYHTDATTRISFKDQTSSTELLLASRCDEGSFEISLRPFCANRYF